MTSSVLLFLQAQILSRKSSENREKFYVTPDYVVLVANPQYIPLCNITYRTSLCNIRILQKIKRTSIKLQSNLNRKPHFLTSLAPSLLPAIRNKHSSAQISRCSSPTSIQKLTLLYDFPSCCHFYLSHSPTSAVPVLSKYTFTMLLLLRALQQNLFGLF